MTTFLVFLAACVVCGVSVILVCHKHYEDGLLGRISLACVGTAAFARAVGILDGEFDVYINPVATLLWLSLSVFFGRHLYRFLRWHNAGDCDWSRPTDRAGVAGKLPRHS